jgi:hypothetical protein
MKHSKIYKTLIIASLAAIQLLSCNDKNNQTQSPTNSAYKNGIVLEAKGFKVKQAYLVFDDSVKLKEDNIASLGQHVNLELVIDSGWAAENKLIYPGISEKIVSDDGNHVFENSDLMTVHPGGVPVEDGWLVTIQAVINTVDKHYQYFLVSFRVWDKKGTGEIKGSYKLYMK